VTLRSRIGPALAAVGDGALEVEDEGVGLVGEGDDVVTEQRLGWVDAQALGDLAAEHRVAGQRELHARTLPTGALGDQSRWSP
jgi:hypothetical protein